MTPGEGRAGARGGGGASHGRRRKTATSRPKRPSHSTPGGFLAHVPRRARGRARRRESRVPGRRGRPDARVRSSRRNRWMPTFPPVLVRAADAEGDGEKGPGARGQEPGVRTRRRWRRMNCARVGSVFGRYLKPDPRASREWRDALRRKGAAPRGSTRRPGSVGDGGGAQRRLRRARSSGAGSSTRTVQVAGGARTASTEEARRREPSRARRRASTS